MLNPGTKLGCFEVVAFLGAGGMGEVYRARDPRLRRDVALKVLPDSLTRDEDALARFAREAQAVAALSHPAIRRIYDIQTDGGMVFAAMELLEGETLRARLKNVPLSESEALVYALQVAQGLAAAHDKHIVHRDLKPENLFVTKEGEIKILDFGLARSEEALSEQLGSWAAPTVTMHTRPGAVMGTPGYMSPEQLKGFEVDHRSDLFSFGVVLYEMLTGRRAFQRDTAAETVAAILKEEPAAPGGRGRPLSSGVERIIRRCLEKSPEKRFQSAHEIVCELQSVAAGAVSTAPPAVSTVSASPHPRRLRRAAATLAVITLAVAVALLAHRWKPVPEEIAGPRRIAVLPFENLGAPEDEYFADGIADEVRGRLTLLPGLEVIARGSSTPYKKTAKVPAQIAEELGVSYLLTGTVRWQKSGTSVRVHISPELVEAKKKRAPTARWQQTIEADLTDVFRVQTDIATRVVEALGLALGTGEEKLLGEKPTANLAAYDAFLRAEEVSQRAGRLGPQTLRQAIQHYEKAVALDPGFALAWARLARASALLYFNSTPASAVAERARQAADRALALAPGRPEAHVAMGIYYGTVLRDGARMAQEYAQALRLGPGDTDVASALAIAEQRLGRWEQGPELLRKAEKLDPRSAAAARRLGLTLLRLRRHAEAREAFNRGLALAPTDLALLEYKTMVALAQGDRAGARAVLRSAPREIDPPALVAFLALYFDLVWVLDDEQQDLLLRLTPSAFDNDKAAWALSLAQARALRGDGAKVRELAAEAATELEAQLRAAPDDPQRHALRGVALAYLGRKDQAIREGERAVALLPISRDAYDGPYMLHQLTRIYILTGEQERALDTLEPLLKTPYYLTPAWLEIDPNFSPLRGHPRFERLLKSG